MSTPYSQMIRGGEVVYSKREEGGKKRREGIKTQSKPQNISISCRPENIWVLVVPFFHLFCKFEYFPNEIWESGMTKWKLGARQPLFKLLHAYLRSTLTNTFKV